VIPWIFGLVSVIAVCLVSLVGVLTLSANEERIRHIALVLVSFAVGGLLGDAFIHLIPAAFEDRTSTLEASLLMLGGMLLFFVVEKLLRHQHGPLHRHHHPDAGAFPPLAAINVVGDAVHNLIDGLMIGASYLVSPGLGLSTTVAVLLHEIPQEVGDFGILVHSGLTVRRALMINLMSASVAILGTVVALIAGTAAPVAVTSALVPLTAGGFVYIAAADLIPELHHDQSLRGVLVQVGFVASGIGVMALLTLVE
jgi:zinc and cadmium transporter